MAAEQTSSSSYIMQKRVFIFNILKVMKISNKYWTFLCIRLFEGVRYMTLHRYKTYLHIENCKFLLVLFAANILFMLIYPEARYLRWIRRARTCNFRCVPTYEYLLPTIRVPTTYNFRCVPRMSCTCVMSCHEHPWKSECSETSGIYLIFSLL